MLWIAGLLRRRGGGVRRLNDSAGPYTAFIQAQYAQCSCLRLSHARLLESSARVQ